MNSFVTISKMNTKKNPNPTRLIITELILYSILYTIKTDPPKQIIPLIKGNRYKKESSIATLVVNIYMVNKDCSENQDKNSDIINNIEPVNPNKRKSKYFLIFKIFSHIYEF